MHLRLCYPSGFFLAPISRKQPLIRRILAMALAVGAFDAGPGAANEPQTIEITFAQANNLLRIENNRLQPVPQKAVMELIAAPAKFHFLSVCFDRKTQDIWLGGEMSSESGYFRTLLLRSQDRGWHWDDFLPPVKDHVVSGLAKQGEELAVAIAPVTDEPTKQISILFSSNNGEGWTPLPLLEVRDEEGWVSDMAFEGNDALLVEVKYNGQDIQGIGRYRYHRKAEKWTEDSIAIWQLIEKDIRAMPKKAEYTMMEPSGDPSSQPVNRDDLVCGDQIALDEAGGIAVLANPQETNALLMTYAGAAWQIAGNMILTWQAGENGFWTPQVGGAPPQ